MVDNYIEKYDEETERSATAVAAMDKVIENSMDEEAKESSIDEKLKMKAQSEEKLGSIAGFIRNIDGALEALRGNLGDWKEKFPETKAKMQEIYNAHPASLLAKRVQASR